MFTLRVYNVTIGHRKRSIQEYKKVRSEKRNRRFFQLVRIHHIVSTHTADVVFLDRSALDLMSLENFVYRCKKKRNNKKKMPLCLRPCTVIPEILKDYCTEN